MGIINISISSKGNIMTDSCSISLQTAQILAEAEKHSQEFVADTKPWILILFALSDRIPALECLADQTFRNDDLCMKQERVISMLVLEADNMISIDLVGFASKIPVLLNKWNSILRQYKSLEESIQDTSCVRQLMTQLFSVQQEFVTRLARHIGIPIAMLHVDENNNIHVTLPQPG